LRLDQTFERKTRQFVGLAMAVQQAGLSLNLQPIKVSHLFL
jgi:hypothetical protein